MDCKRFMQLRDLIGYDNLHMAKMLDIDVSFQFAIKMTLCYTVAMEVCHGETFFYRT
jgi:hypothetical protein